MGLIPENEIIQTNAPGVFVIGNARYVHDLVDQVSQEGLEAAGEAAKYLIQETCLNDGKAAGEPATAEFQFDLAHLSEARKRKAAELEDKKQLTLDRQKGLDKQGGRCTERWKGRAEGGDSPGEITCVLCPNGCGICQEGRDISGAQCEKGRQYAREALVEKRRVLTTSVKVQGGRLPLVSVRTDGRIPRACFQQAM